MLSVMRKILFYSNYVISIHTVFRKKVPLIFLL